MDQRLSEPAGAAPPDWRGLCAELANYLQGRKDREYGWPGEDPEQDLLDRVHASLAQPEPEVVGPTDEELRKLWCEKWDPTWEWGSLRYARAVLARWGNYPAKPDSSAPAPAGEVES